MSVSITSKEFVYEKSDVLKALRYHFISRSEIKLLIIVVNFFTIITAILFALKKINADIFIWSSILWLIIFVTIWWGLPLIIWRKEKTFTLRLSLLLDEIGLTITTTNGKQFWHWDKFLEHLNAPDFVYMYLSKNAFFLIPKSIFINEDFNIAYQLIKTHVKEKK